MCILFISTNPNPEDGEFRVIIASNRDEVYERPAKEAYSCTNTNIFGGRDFQENRENGMWLGLKVKKNKEKLCISCLLNVTGEERNSGVQSRGFIVPNYLDSEQSSIDYFQNLTKATVFNAFNLVNVELTKKEVSTYFMSKHPDQICKFPGKQTLGFGNSPVNRPLGKVRNGRDKFDHIVQTSKDKEELKLNLIDFLKSSEKYLPDPELERRAPQHFEYLSSIFVRIPNIYGTRTHTIILVDKDWNIEFYEETMESPINPQNIVWKKTSLKSCL